MVDASKIGSSKALVLFSGGQDSTTCLAWALENFCSVETVGFDYGQRHAAEMKARPRVLAALRKMSTAWCEKLGPDHVLPLELLRSIGGSALTDSIAIAFSDNGLPTSFVPGRNLLFLTAAASLGIRREAPNLVGGMCETDYSGYPDCRDETLKALNKAIDLGFACAFFIHTPLMWLDKSSTWRLAEKLGGRKLVDLILEETVTCYHGDREHRHVWGYGCGECPACLLRAKGYDAYARAESVSP